MIKLNMTTIWKDFSQYISKYVVWKSDPLNILSSVYIQSRKSVYFGDCSNKPHSGLFEDMF